MNVNLNKCEKFYTLPHIIGDSSPAIMLEMFLQDWMCFIWSDSYL